MRSQLFGTNRLASNCGSSLSGLKADAVYLAPLGKELQQFVLLLTEARGQNASGSWYRVWKCLDKLLELMHPCANARCRDSLRDIYDALNLLADRWYSDETGAIAERALKASEQFLQQPHLTVYIPVSKLHFTHNSVAEAPRHGHHAGYTREELVTRIVAEEESPHSKDWILDVTRYDGKYWSLNNRHLWVLARVDQLRCQQASSGLEARARVWPLNDVVQIRNGHGLSGVISKLIKSLSTEDAGWSVRARGGSATPEPPKSTGLATRTPGARARSCTPPPNRGRNSARASITDAGNTVRVPGAAPETAVMEHNELQAPRHQAVTANEQPAGVDSHNAPRARPKETCGQSNMGKMSSRRRSCSPPHKRRLRRRQGSRGHVSASSSSSSSASSSSSSSSSSRKSQLRKPSQSFRQNVLQRSTAVPNGQTSSRLCMSPARGPSQESGKNMAQGSATTPDDTTPCSPGLVSRDPAFHAEEVGTRLLQVNTNQKGGGGAALYHEARANVVRAARWKRGAIRLFS